MPIKCLVVDDEKLARELIAEYIQKVPDLELVESCPTAISAQSVLRKEAIDLLFLDIQMPDLTGIEFIESLKNPPAFIFTTAYRDYATEGFELDALDYLIKPISFQRFLKAANKARTHFELKNQMSQKTETAEAGHFFIKSDGQYIKIQLDDVLYFESERDYIFIFTKQKRYLTLLSLKQLEKELPPEKFIRVHRSFIVAVDQVEMMDGNQLKIRDRQIPVSRSMQEKVYKTLIEGKLWKRDM